MVSPCLFFFGYREQWGLSWFSLTLAANLLASFSCVSILLNSMSNLKHSHDLNNYVCACDACVFLWASLLLRDSFRLPVRCPLVTSNSNVLFSWKYIFILTLPVLVNDACCSPSRNVEVILNYCCALRLYVKSIT